MLVSYFSMLLISFSQDRLMEKEKEGGRKKEIENCLRTYTFILKILLMHFCTLTIMLVVTCVIFCVSEQMVKCFFVLISYFL